MNVLTIAIILLRIVNMYLNFVRTIESHDPQIVDVILLEFKTVIVNIVHINSYDVQLIFFLHKSTQNEQILYVTRVNL